MNFLDCVALLLQVYRQLWIVCVLLSGMLLCPAMGVANDPMDSRLEMPAAFNYSWIGLSAGVANTNFTASDFQSGFDFNDQNDSIGALRLRIGHYFNPYWAMSINLMRGIHSNKFSDPVPSTIDGVDVSTQTNSVSETVLGLTLLPTLPLSEGVTLYGEGGLALISRNGFDIEGLPVVSDTNMVTGMIGGGLTYLLPGYDSHHLFLNIELLYTLPVDSQQQPGIFYTGVGLNYMLFSRFASGEVQDVNTAEYVFPLNTLQLDYMNENWFYIDAAPYFTPPDSIPVFFNGHIKISHGTALTYERNFFHTSRYFSLEWGASCAAWQTRDLHQDFYTFSIFPEMKIWMLRADACDLYFTYSLAGPSYISERYLDNQDSGSHFTFQDFLGFGALIGNHKQLNLSLKIVHYSNGNLIPQNPGVDVPVMLGLGYNW